MTDVAEAVDPDYETHIEPKCISKDEFGYVDVADILDKKGKSFVQLHVRGSGLLTADEVKELMAWLTEWSEAYAG